MIWPQSLTGKPLPTSSLYVQPAQSSWFSQALAQDSAEGSWIFWTLFQPPVISPAAWWMDLSSMIVEQCFLTGPTLFS
jgi:hypothetical protein